MNASVVSEHYQVKEEKYYSSERADIRRRIPVGVRSLLDVGCGRGEFGRGVKRVRPQVHVTGIEFTDWAAEARQHLDAVHQIDASDADAARLGPFDCITFNDVLEHLFDPERVVRNLCQSLKPGGSVLASSPNLRYFYTMHALLLRGRFDYVQSGPMDFTHIRFFTFQTFAELFRRCGLEVEEVSGLAGAEMSSKFRVMNWLSRGAMDDMRYIQIFVKARKPEA